MHESRTPSVIALVNILENGVNNFHFDEYDDADILELRADDVSSLWSMGPCRAVDPGTSEFYGGCMIFVTIIPVDGRNVFRVWVIDNQGESVHYSEE